MQMSDVIADMLTRIRNAGTARHETVDIPASNMKKAIADILLEEGYVKGVQVIEDGRQGIIRVTLKYGQGKKKHDPRYSPCFQTRSPYLFELRGYAEGYERPRYRHRIDFKGHYDRQACAQRECRRRDHRLCLVRERGDFNVKNR